MAGRTSLTLADGVTGMAGNVFLNVINDSKVITAVLEVPEDAGNGAVIVQGGRFGGWALHVKEGIPACDYNFLGLERTTVAATETLPARESNIRFESSCERKGMDEGGKGTLFVNDKKSGRRNCPARPADGLFRRRNSGRGNRPGHAGC